MYVRRHRVRLKIATIGWIKCIESVVFPPEAKAVRLHVPTGSRLKPALTCRETRLSAILYALSRLSIASVT